MHMHLGVHFYEVRARWYRLHNTLVLVTPRLLCAGCRELVASHPACRSDRYRGKDNGLANCGGQRSYILLQRRYQRNFVGSLPGAGSLFSRTMVYHIFIIFSLEKLPGKSQSWAAQKSTRRRRQRECKNEATPQIEQDIIADETLRKLCRNYVLECKQIELAGKLLAKLGQELIYQESANTECPGVSSDV